jgi:hypothetical protein
MEVPDATSSLAASLTQSSLGETITTKSNQTSSISPKLSNMEDYKSVRLDFNNLPDGVFGRFESTPGIDRYFCETCGAKVFWHDREESPGLVNVSVGLLDSKVGARAEDWLWWWCGRVAFEEENEIVRPDHLADSEDPPAKQVDMVKQLAIEMAAWGDEKHWTKRI